MTDRTWLGGGNNNARNPHDWSPTGAPQPGDTLLMFNGGTMNVRDDDLAGNSVHVGDQAGLPETFNLSHHAMLAVVQNVDTGSETVVNVHGRDTLRFSSVFPSGPQLTVNLDPHARLTASFNMVFGSLTVNGDDKAKLVNDENDSLSGVHTVITPDVLGIGSFKAGTAQGVGGFLEFGHSVSRDQSVTVSGDPERSLATVLKIDKPREFHAAVTMQAKTETDLVGLAKADSYTFENDMLKIFSGNCLIDQLRLTNDGTFIGQPHDLVVSKGGSDVFLTQAGLTSPPIGSITLPLHT